MPYWDNGPAARYAIPGRDGYACMFRLGGQYEVDGAKDAFLLIALFVNRKQLNGFVDLTVNGRMAGMKIPNECAGIPML